MKAIKVAGGFVVKRKARVEHDCDDCHRLIESAEEYYQLTLSYFRGYFTKCICEQCWQGRRLEA